MHQSAPDRRTTPLALVGLLASTSSAAVGAVLPAYLVLVVHLGPALFGILNGLCLATVSASVLLGGHLADRTAGRRWIVGLGTGSAALARLGLAGVGAGTIPITLLLVLDRAGTGLTVRAREALARLSPGRTPHWARAGAVVGPGLAWGVLTATGEATAVLSAAAGTAALASVLLLLLVPDMRRPLAPRRSVSPDRARRALAVPGVRGQALAAATVGLTTIGEGFVLLLLQHREHLALAWFPALALAGGAVTLLVRRHARGRPGLACAALAATYLLLAGPWSGPPVVVAVVALHGLALAASGPGPSACRALPGELRASALALVATGRALGSAVASAVFGLGWALVGPGACLGSAGVTAALGSAAVPFLLSGSGPRWRGRR